MKNLDIEHQPVPAFTGTHPLLAHICRSHPRDVVAYSCGAFCPRVGIVALAEVDADWRTGRFEAIAQTLFQVAQLPPRPYTKTTAARSPWTPQ